MKKNNRPAGSIGRANSPGQAAYASLTTAAVLRGLGDRAEMGGLLPAEQISARQAAGMVLILISVWLVNRP